MTQPEGWPRSPEGQQKANCQPFAHFGFRVRFFFEFLRAIDHFSSWALGVLMNQSVSDSVQEVGLLFQFSITFQELRLIDSEI